MHDLIHHMRSEVHPSRVNHIVRVPPSVVLLRELNEALSLWGLPPQTLAFCCARLVLQTARYRGQRSAWQLGATAPTSPFSAVLGLLCIRLATAGNDALGRLGLPPPRPRIPLRSACLADGPLPRAATNLAGWSCRPHPPDFRCARLVLQEALYRGQRSACNR